MLWQTSTGTARRATGLAIVAPEAAVVFTAGWPFADAAALEVTAVRPASLRVALITAIDSCELGEHPLGSGPNRVTLAIPAGCFDSGLVEFRFRSDAAAGLVLERLTLDDTRALSPPF